eukprot:TRINITY_DN70514_c0_g1_i1.p1 TRINITY_DN70514_c0_g1~~TRINITY_DN70514_c0_g1_i1.p1  ORF type:complete len:121 (-),score=15.43 TRINITY_DN70514_c0_g1_i1:130-492(-)
MWQENSGLGLSLRLALPRVAYKLKNHTLRQSPFLQLWNVALVKSPFFSTLHLKATYWMEEQSDQGGCWNCRPSTVGSTRQVILIYNFDNHTMGVLVGMIILSCSLCFINFLKKKIPSLPA